MPGPAFYVLQMTTDDHVCNESFQYRSCSIKSIPTGHACSAFFENLFSSIVGVVFVPFVRYEYR